MDKVDLDEARRRSGLGPLLLITRRAGMLLMNLLIIVVLARLVSPQAFGLANMAQVCLLFGHTLRDFGMTNSVLRRPTIDPGEVNFMFWFNAGTTLSIAAVIAAASPWIAAYYHEPQVVGILLVSLIGFVAMGFGVQHRALLYRDMQFATLGIIDVAAVTTNFVVGVTLALVWPNVWAIVLGTLAQSLVTAGGYVACSGWRPGWPNRPERMHEILRFGANTLVFALSNFLSNNAASVLVGRYASTAGLGQFSRAQTLAQIPTTNFVQPMTEATIPLLSRLRPFPDEYAKVYLQLVGKLCVVLIPASAAMSVCGRDLIVLVLGGRWSEAGWVFSAMAPSLAGVGICFVVSDLFFTQDRSAELRTIGLFEAVVRVGAIALAVTHGTFATGVAFSASTVFCSLVRITVAGRTGPVSVAAQLGAALPSLPMAAVAVAGSLLAMQHLHPLNLPIWFTAPAEFAGGLVPALLLGCALPAARAQLLGLARNFGLHKLVGKLRRQRASHVAA